MNDNLGEELFYRRAMALPSEDIKELTDLAGITTECRASFDREIRMCLLMFDGFHLPTRIARTETATEYDARIFLQRLVAGMTG
jgi:hypothetical protein